MVGIGSLVAVGLVGGFVLFGTAREPSPGPEPRVPVAEQEPDLPAARPGPSAPEPERTQRQRDPAPLSTFRDTLQDGSSGPEMVVLPADQFKMGCVSGKDCLDRELPVRTVTFEEPFAIGKHEVTFAEYDRYAAATNVEKPGDQGWGRGPRPVINVAWSDAAAYCDWLGEQTGRRYRLPSEAQWEYAARAGTATPWSFGDDAAVLGDYGWYFGNADGQTHPVGKKRPNPWGLCDMHGNVWEWVQDSWHGSYEGAPDDGTAWESGGSGAARVIRGGSWGVYAQGCRSAVRGDGQPGGRYYYLGFRCARAQE